jgi:hypothetical protein
MILYTGPEKKPKNLPPGHEDQGGQHNSSAER